MVVSSPYGQEFYSLGIDTNDTVIVIGEQNGDIIALYELTGTNFQVTPLPQLSNNPRSERAEISRDGQYIVGETVQDDIIIPALLFRSQPDVAIYPSPLPEDNAYPTDVTSTGNGPLVTIRSSHSSFIWTLNKGMEPWLTNDRYLSRLMIQCTSSNGKDYGGYEIFFSDRTGSVILPAIAGTETNFTYLSPSRSTNSRVVTISPNGRFLAGYDDLHATVWHDGKMKRLPFGKNSLSICDNITDNGFASGIGDTRSMIYDPRSRQAYPFATWWAKRYPQWPLPERIGKIEDLYEHDGKLYCLLSARDDEAGESFSILAIAPIKGLPLAYLKHPKRGYGRFTLFPGWRASS